VYDLFISYHWRDRESVERVARELRERNLKVFLDRWYLIPGRSWVQALEQTLGDCKAIAIFLGPHGMGRWQQREKELALDRQARDVTFPVIPVLLAGSDPALGFLQVNTWVDLRHGPTPEAIDVLVRAAHGQPPGEDLKERFASAFATVCPYRGLRYFREEDEPFFCGRESFTEKIVETVRTRNMIAVVGASGSGKSSVVRAGLLPALRRGKDRRVWDMVAMLPQDRPFHSLAVCFLPLLEPDITEVDRLVKIDGFAEWLAEGKSHLRATVERTLEKEPGTDRLLLVVDQWEELYTLCRDDPMRQRFIDELLDASTNGRLTVVLTLRGDFFGRALSDRGLSDRLQGGIVTIGPMTREELHRAIVEPADQVGLRLEEGLDRRILDEVGEEPGSLPLLEFLLYGLWERRREGLLLHEAYDAIGGVRKAIAERAEKAFESLALVEQEIARSALVQLVVPGENAEDSRRRVNLEQLDPSARSVIAKLTTERLLVATHDASGREVVEVGHEALIREWGRLRKWVDDDREFLRTLQRLEEESEFWKSHGKPADLLLPCGRRVEEADEHLRIRANMMGPRVQEYIRASRRVCEEHQRRGRRIRYAAGLAAIVAASGVVLAAMISYNNWVETRPWAYLVRLSTGQTYPLKQELALIGRHVPDMNAIKLQVDLPQPISRIHVAISRNGAVMDWRSAYGTTLNAEPLLYGSEGRLKTGDILVLSGQEVLAYQLIDWHSWHFLPFVRAPDIHRKATLSAPAVLVAGKRVLSMFNEGQQQQFVALRKDGIELSDEPSENSVLVVRRRVFSHPEALPTRRLQTLKSTLGSEPTDAYSAIIAVLEQGEENTGPIRGQPSVLTLQPSPTANDRIKVWIKERDYDIRPILLPADSETVAIAVGDDGDHPVHGIGEILFETQAGFFQVVPSRGIEPDHAIADQHL
jgi:TIR domain/FHA domain